MIQVVSPIVASAFSASAMAAPVLEMGQISSLAKDTDGVLNVAHADPGGTTATLMHWEETADGNGQVMVDHQIDTGMVTALGLMDLDGDGDLDLLVGETEPDAVAIYINEGEAMVYNSLSDISFTPYFFASARNIIPEEAFDRLEDAGLDINNAVAVFSEDDKQLPTLVFNPTDAEPKVVQLKIAYTTNTLLRTAENIGLQDATFEEGDFTQDSHVSIDDVTYLINDGELIEDPGDVGGDPTGDPQEAVGVALIGAGVAILLTVGTCLAISASCEQNRDQAIGNCQTDCRNDAADIDEFFDCATCCYDRGNGLSCLCVPFNSGAAQLGGCQP